MAQPERFGSYLVYEQIGAGGMATVHRAEHVEKDGRRTEVALKRLNAQTAQNRHLVDAFATEARLLRYLDHSNIAQTYDHGKAVGGTYFIAMEYVRGRTLKALVQNCKTRAQTVPNEIALNIAAQLCDALDYAHTARDENDRPLGIIHRDVCPANIMLSEAGFVKLIDFGLAKTKAARTRNHDTAKGIIKGKFNYVAPEYIDGELDPRADLWAVGVVLYELLTSRRLFNGANDLETIGRVRRLPIPRPSLANPRVSAELDEIVLKALQREPRFRWQSALRMGEALRSVIAQSGHYVDYRQVADWVKSVYADDPAEVVAARRKAQSTPVVAFPVVTTYPNAPRTSIVDTIAKGAKRLLRRQTK
jgi:serine/threonine protein kinase